MWTPTPHPGAAKQTKRQHAQAHRRNLQIDVDVKRRINDTATSTSGRKTPQEARKPPPRSETSLLNAAQITSNATARRAACPGRHGDPVLNHEVPPGLEAAVTTSAPFRGTPCSNHGAPKNSAVHPVRGFCGCNKTQVTVVIQKHPVCLHPMCRHESQRQTHKHGNNASPIPKEQAPQKAQKGC